MNEKLLSFLGLARKAGKLDLGHDPAMDGIRLGRPRVVLLGKDLSPRTAKGILREAEEAGIPVILLEETMDEIGGALGRRTGVIAVNDDGFAKKVKALCADR